MKIAKGRVIQKIIAMLIIMIMTFADFSLVGKSMISYAIDMVVTNNNNVQFSAYFVKKQGEIEEKVTEIEQAINSKDLVLHVEVAVKNEGYFNGAITLGDSSFNFSEYIPSEYIKSVEGNTVTLNQINHGTTAEIELKVNYNNSNHIKASSLNQDNIVNLNGTYTNSKDNDEITGTTSVKVNWLAPEGTEALLSSKILTNEIYKINKANKRVVQILIDSKLKNNAYPVSETKIAMKLPTGAEDVKVNTRSTYATNGNENFDNNNYTFDANTGDLTITLNNTEKEGMVYWNKNVRDTLVVTCIYPEDKIVNKETIDTGVTIKTLEDVEIKVEYSDLSRTEIKENVDGIVTNEILVKESEIYKGKIYTGEERKYTTTTVLNVDYNELVESIEIEEKETKFKTENESKEANIEYIETRIEKAKFDKIFGEEGHIIIYDQDGATIANINKDTTVTDGDIVIKYNSGVTSLSIKTSKPVSNGIMDIVHTKSILNSNIDREEIRKIVAIEETVARGYNDGEKTKTITKAIELKETSSKANIKISQEKLSTIKTNENVDIVATLETNDETKDLYKEPIVKIVFPKEIEEVHVISAEALYTNGLEIAEKSQDKNENGNIVFTIKFKNEQTKYDSEILNGLELHFKANIVVNKTTPSKEVSLRMGYTNKNGIEDTYEVNTKIQLESKYGLMLYNKVENFNEKSDVIETMDSTKVVGKLGTNKKDVAATVKTVLINNYNVDFENIEIVGNLTKEEQKEEVEAIISNLHVSDENAKVYYNKVANAASSDDNWTEESSGARAYKITLGKFEVGSKIQIAYKLNIKDNLTYNLTSNLVTSVKTKLGDKEGTINSTIAFATEEVVVPEEPKGETTETEEGLKYNITAVSGNKELNEENNTINNGETIKYTLKIANNTGKDYENLTVKVAQTNGLIFDLIPTEVFNPLVYTETGYGIENYWGVTDSNEKEFKNIKIRNGKVVTLEYQVIANKTEGNETFGNITINSAEGSTIGTLETEKYNINDAELKLLFIPTIAEEFFWTTETTQQANLFITNTTDTEIKNAEVKIVVSDGLSCGDDYLDCDEYHNVIIKNKETNSLGQTIVTLEVDKIAPGETAEIYVYPYLETLDTKKANLEFFATATTGANKLYSSNKIIREAVQIRKQIKVQQGAKINGKVATDKAILHNGDKLDFYIKIENKSEEYAKLNVYNYFQTGLNIKSITFEREGNKTDLMNEYNEEEGYFYYKFDLPSGHDASIIISTEVDALYMIEEKAVKNKLDVSDIETGDIYETSIEYVVDVEELEDEEPEIIPDPDPDPNPNPNPDPDPNPNPNPDLNPNPNPNPDSDPDPNPNPDPDPNPDPNPNPDPDPDPDPNPDPNPDVVAYTVSGLAWMDNNKNGKRDKDEETVQNMEVKAINTKTEEVLTTTARTNGNGTYEISLPEGEYIIVFMYDDENYYITTYHAKKVKDNVNSDAVTKTLNINNEEITAGATDVIKLNGDKKNIDIGIISRKKFDLKIDKTVKKIVVTNNGGTSEYNFDDSSLAKVEIAAKHLSGSTVVVEYKIKVTNVGDIDGYVKNIVDFMPSDMKFSSSLNKDWYQSGKYLYNESIADEKLTPGESYEVDLILTKTMTDSNTGLVNNTAEIKSSYNEKSFSDANKENNSSLADVIIGVKTGAAIRLALLTISLTTLIAVSAYYVIRKYINKKI